MILKIWRMSPRFRLQPSPLFGRGPWFGWCNIPILIFYMVTLSSELLPLLLLVVALGMLAFHADHVWLAIFRLLIHFLLTSWLRGGVYARWTKPWTCSWERRFNSQTHWGSLLRKDSRLSSGQSKFSLHALYSFLCGDWRTDNTCCPDVIHLHIQWIQVRKLRKMYCFCIYLDVNLRQKPASIIWISLNDDGFCQFAGGSMDIAARWCTPPVASQVNQPVFGNKASLVNHHLSITVPVLNRVVMRKTWTILISCPLCMWDWQQYNTYHLCEGT